MSEVSGEVRASGEVRTEVADQLTQHLLQSLDYCLRLFHSQVYRASPAVVQTKANRSGRALHYPHLVCSVPLENELIGFHRAIIGRNVDHGYAKSHIHPGPQVSVDK